MRERLASCALVVGLLLAAPFSNVQAQYRMEVLQSAVPTTPEDKAAVDALTAEMQKLRLAQDRFFEANGRYAEDFGALLESERPQNGTIIIVTASEKEWAAAGTVPGTARMQVIRVRRLEARSTGPQ
jgi:hypothetical protein